ncbi:MAG: D-aminoacyl-tRNA deacylase [Candidatus Micrarchaeia archaeon]
MPTIVYSEKDAAGSNIARFLNCKAVHLKEELVDCSRDFGSDLVLFASRHASVSGAPCLAVHCTGNWGAAGKGGAPRTLSLASARASKCALDWLKAHPLKGFDVFLEATHHGPTHLSAPSLFIEAGSTPKEWANEAAAKRVAECIEFVRDNWTSTTGTVALGFGGGHYCPAFNSLNYAFSHIAAKYALESVDEIMLRQAIEKTVEPVECAVIDWKGCRAAERERVTKACAANGLDIVRV